MPLDSKMEYYNIRLIKNVSNICKIIVPWVKYCYKRLTMVVANSLDIFQQKMNDSFYGFEFIRAYIYDLLILTKKYWTDHIQKMNLMLNKLKGEVLKCNIKN